MDFYLQLLKDELAERCAKNSQYSVRSFAKSLAIDNSTMSRILNRRTIPNRETSEHIADKLFLAPGPRYQFLCSVERSRSGKVERELPADIKFQSLPEPVSNEMSLSALLILETLNCNGCNGKIDDIATRTNLSQDEIQASAALLQRLGLVTVTDQTLVSHQLNNMLNVEKHATPAVKNVIRESLRASLAAVDTFDDQTGKFETMTMAIDPALLPEAKRRINNFIEELTHFLQQEGREQVFHLGIQLFPLGNRPD